MPFFCLGANFYIEITQYRNDIFFGHLFQSFFKAGIEILYFKLHCTSCWGIVLDNCDPEGFGTDSDGYVIINHQVAFCCLGEFFACDKCQSICFPDVMSYVINSEFLRLEIAIVYLMQLTDAVKVNFPPGTLLFDGIQLTLAHTSDILHCHPTCLWAALPMPVRFAPSASMMPWLLTADACSSLVSCWIASDLGGFINGTISDSFERLPIKLFR